jgi:hypothetical protein
MTAVRELDAMEASLEGIDGKELDTWVGRTEIRGFEGCCVIGSEDLAAYLTALIPPSHLEGCPSIEFDPQNPNFLAEPDTLGFFECDSHAIHIASEDSFPDGIEGLLDTITHEVGHNAHAALMETSPSLAREWDGMHASSPQRSLGDGLGFVSEYAKTSQFEDFAESYMTYVRDPGTLMFASQEKYQFLRDHVFYGREY